MKGELIVKIIEIPDRCESCQFYHEFEVTPWSVLTSCCLYEKKTENSKPVFCKAKQVEIKE
jgi:hypothetical protein